jgi:hypothetical protein
MFTRWPDIESFAHILRNRAKILADPTIDMEASIGFNLGRIPGLAYLAKIKLDGSNSAVRFIYENGKLTLQGFQSRNQDVTPENDNFGFARWASQVDWNVKLSKAHCLCKDSSHKHLDKQDERLILTIHGEWAGPGIPTSTSVGRIPNKTFFVYAVQVTSLDNPKQDFIYLDFLDHYFNEIPENVKILHFIKKLHKVHFDNQENLEAFAKNISEEINKIEIEDPYIMDTFGISGPGEGYVYYPLTTNIHEVCFFMFKAKGEKHRVKLEKAAATTSVEALESIQAFVQTFVTVPRCEQGIKVIFQDEPVEMKKAGDFLRWLTADIEKESKAELEASGLTWKQVLAEVQKAARTWFIVKAKQNK